MDLDELGLAGQRVVIVHHDDLGMTHAQNQAHLALTPYPTGSVMLPTAWATDWAGRQDVDLGVHITLTSEWRTPRWRPLTNGSSLRDPHGYFWPTVEQAWASIRTAEAEAEMRAQIEAALALGLDITHIDTHMGGVMRPDIAAAYSRLADELRVPALMPTIEMLDWWPMPAEWRQELLALMESSPLPKMQVIDCYTVPPAERCEAYIRAVEGVGPGLYHFIHHAQLATPEGRVLPDWEGRQADFDALASPALQQALAGFTHLTYRELRDRLRGEKPPAAGYGQPADSERAAQR